MSVQSKIAKQKTRRALSVRARLRRDCSLVRVSVFRSLNEIYAQVIDDLQHKTLVSVSSLTLKVEGTKTEIAHVVGKELAKKALEQGITKAAFDRGRFLYHGRIKALAEGLREGGLQI